MVFFACEEGTQGNEIPATKFHLIEKPLSELIEMTIEEYGIEVSALYGKAKTETLRWHERRWFYFALKTQG